MYWCKQPEGVVKCPFLFTHMTVFRLLYLWILIMWRVYKPFIKRVWWKRQLLEQYESLFPRSFLDHKIAHYYEPFLWWWAVFFDLRNKFWLNFHADLYDINTELINTYQVIKDSPELIITELKNMNTIKKHFLRLEIGIRIQIFK